MILLLPDPGGSLSKKVDCRTTEEAYDEVSTVIADAGGSVSHIKTSTRTGTTIGL